MGTRRKARELALQALYQRDMTGRDGVRGLDSLREQPGSDEDEEAFAERLVHGVVEHGREIDGLIEDRSENWRLERMPSVDRNILRIATFELLYCDEIPPKVSLNEAIELGKRFGAQESGGFINGILDRIMSYVDKTKAIAK